MAIPIEWRASILGAEDVKQKLSEIRQEYAKGQIGIQEYGEKQRFLVRQARGTNLTLGQQKSIFMAMHPQLNKLSQAMSIFGQVSRSALSIMNALNLATVAKRTSDQALFDLKLQELGLLKDIRDIELGGVTEEEQANLDEKKAALSEVRQEMENLRKEAKDQDWNDLWTKISAVAEAITTAVGTGLSIAVFTGKIKIPELIAYFTSLGSGIGSAILSGLGKIAIPVAIVDFLSMMGEQFAGDGEIATGLNALIEIFTKDIPNALGNMKVNWVNTFMELKLSTENFVNTVVGGFEALINGIIAVVNTFIDAWNRVASSKLGKKLNMGTVGKLEEISLGRLGGESGKTTTTSKAVPFSQSQFGASAGGIITINVAGSILSERELKDLTGEALKERLKRAGF